VSYNIQDADITAGNQQKKVLEVFAVMRPFIEFLNRSIE